MNSLVFSAESCVLRPLGGATCNSGFVGATNKGTQCPAPAPKALSMNELRAQLCMQLQCNRRVEQVQSEAEKSCIGLTPDSDGESALRNSVADVRRMLDRDPALRLAVKTHDDPNSECVILAVAIRDKGTCELVIPKADYDGVALLELIAKHASR